MLTPQIEPRARRPRATFTPVRPYVSVDEPGTRTYGILICSFVELGRANDVLARWWVGETMAVLMISVPVLYNML